MDETGTIAPGPLCPVSAALLFCDPAPDVLRAVEQRHAIALAVSQEKNGFPINQGEFFEIEHYRRSVVVDEQLQIRQMLHLHSAYQPDGCALPTAVLFDFPTHIQPNSQLSHRVAISRPFASAGIIGLYVVEVESHSRHLPKPQHGTAILRGIGKREGEKKEKLSVYDVL